jgi:hypothetical protein
MLMPHSYVWTPLQKWLIVGAVVMALALGGSAIYYCERHYRVTDDVYVGTWAFPPLAGDEIYFRLNADRTFRTFTDTIPEAESPLYGSWFGGGKFLYFRQPTFDKDGFVTDGPLLVWRVESISPNELQVRLNPDGWPRTVRRVTAESP